MVLAKRGIRSCRKRSPGAKATAKLSGGTESHTKYCKSITTEK